MSHPASSSEVLAVDGLSKRFGATTAVNELRLSVAAGRTLGLLGVNGAGKTTTIKLLMGLLRRDAGMVRVLGVDPVADPLSVRRRVGYVPEQHLIHRWMRIGDAVAFCRPFFPTWNDALTGRLVTEFGLDPRKRVRHLSKGMLVKLSLVLALAHEPELLLLDEPMAGLDPIAREELLDGVLRSICERPRTILLSSHTLSDVQRLSDEIAILHEGRLLVHSPIDELLRRTKRIRAVLVDGCAPSERPAGLFWERVQNREWLLSVKDFEPATVELLRTRNRVENVQVIDIGLEDVFKDYVRSWRART